MTSHSEGDSENDPEVLEPELEMKVRLQRPIKATTLEKDKLNLNNF